MEKTFKKTYMISGYTKTGKFVTIGFCSGLDILAKFFAQKYPRFIGKANIKTQMAQDMGDGVLCADSANWELVDSFESTKELQKYQNGE